jgi:hypothetical protein
LNKELAKCEQQDAIKASLVLPEENKLSLSQPCSSRYFFRMLTTQTSPQLGKKKKKDDQNITVRKRIFLHSPNSWPATEQSCIFLHHSIVKTHTHTHMLSLFVKELPTSRT